MKKSKAEWIADIRKSIETNDAAAIRALLVVYSYQTRDEQAEGTVRYHNGAGFSPVHAELLTSFYNFFLAHGTLTQKQMIWAKKHLVHYARQLFENAVAEGRYTKEGRYYVATPKLRQEVSA